MKAAIYTRVSTNEQAESGYSLHAQERACRLLCELREYEVADVYMDDGHSGTRTDRPAFQQMLSAAAVGAFKVVVVHKLDRLTRNTQTLLSTVEAFAAREIVLISVTEQMDFTSPIGRVILSMLGSFAQYAIDNLRQETAKGLREKARQGQWVGPVPFGYQKVDGNLIPSDDAGIVQEIYRMYATGEYSYWDVADILNHAGKRMYRWKQRDRVEFRREAIRVILHNRSYLGYVSSGTEYQGNHQPLIEPGVWERVQAIARQRTKRTATSPRQFGLLTGLAYCEVCGRRMWLRCSGRSGESRAYECAGRKAQTCTSRQSRADLVEHQAMDLMRLLVVEQAGSSPPEQRRILHTVVVKLWLLEHEIAAITPTDRYRMLIELLGWKVRNP